MTANGSKRWVEVIRAICYNTHMRKSFLHVFIDTCFVVYGGCGLYFKMKVVLQETASVCYPP